MVFASYEQCKCFVLLLYIISSQTYAITFFTAGKEECWWTGCQLSTWAVIGCDQYNRTQKNVKECDGGSEYYCCMQDSEAQVQLAVDDCWWTGCQPNDWAIKGCDSYNRTERNRMVCGVDGFRYECCARSDTATASNPDSRDYPDENCKWSECQPKEKSYRGCRPDTVQIGLHACPGGDLFQCCSKKIPVDG
ncbi:uncharacterized protein LOC113553990 [Rhopalosiphum maidis]|uniref:uncharacterized protein LOC113553990 n=1 Tax=Rhopalosiphum maidis TaxID=43146 RepID=UPI000EFE2B44|nr:uncharacterized protein LOC113553990 [Rhopalosiphum maidis]